MADEKKPDTIELIAVERGFAMGKLVEPGRKFLFRVRDRNGKERKLPKWAQPANQPLPKKAALKNGDLKPQDAQDAVRAKSGALAGGSPPGPADSLA
jgi:hypothetical protein